MKSAFCLSHLHAQNGRANHMTYNDEPVPEAYWRGVHVGLLWGCMASLMLPFLIDYAFFHTQHTRHTDRVLTRPSVYQAIRLAFPEQEAAGRLAPAAACVFLAMITMVAHLTSTHFCWCCMLSSANADQTD